jgi:hypothetical protein
MHGVPTIASPVKTQFWFVIVNSLVPVQPPESVVVVFHCTDKKNCAANVAVQVASLVIVIVADVAVPEQAPLHPEKPEPDAVKVTTVSRANGAEHTVPEVPQFKLPTFEVTLPPPWTWTVKTGFLVNVAVQVLSFSSVILIVMLVPVQSPPQPVNSEPGAAEAVSCIAVVLNCDEHTVPQSIPTGSDCTDPLPVPALRILRVGGQIMVLLVVKSGNRSSKMVLS